ncbi:MAG: hypothetical protein ACLT1T_12365, partial [Oscillospiraceae bacterium]
DILAGFEHNVRSTRCGLCENHCNLTINDFGGGRRFISGNRCERPLGGTKKADLPNLYKWKLEKLKSYGKPSGIANPIAKIGLPFGLNNFELLPFWPAFLRKLGRDRPLDVPPAICTCRVCIPSRPTRFAIRKADARPHREPA